MIKSLCVTLAGSILVLLASSSLATEVLVEAETFATVKKQRPKAGKHISVSHVAGSSTKMMLNGGQHGQAVGCAAFLCKKYSTTPRGVYEKHLRELQTLVRGFM